MDEAKPLLFLYVALAGFLFFMFATGETSPAAWAFAGILAVAAVAASLIELKRNPELLLQVMTFVTLLLAIFAGVLWLYTRNEISGTIAAVAAPIAVGLAIVSLRFSRRQRAEVRHRDRDRDPR